jgi:hypothetical protein
LNYTAVHIVNSGVRAYLGCNSGRWRGSDMRGSSAEVSAGSTRTGCRDSGGVRRLGAMLDTGSSRPTRAGCSRAW